MMDGLPLTVVIKSNSERQRVESTALQFARQVNNPSPANPVEVARSWCGLQVFNRLLAETSIDEPTAIDTVLSHPDLTEDWVWVGLRQVAMGQRIAPPRLPRALEHRIPSHAARLALQSVDTADNLIMY
jgi:hypothetical protein